MADEGERIGGLYVDVGVDDEGVLARLNAIESTMARLAKQEVLVKVKLVEEGSTTSSRAKKQATVLPATLQLEKDAAQKAVKGLKPVSIPVSLSLANDAISKLQAQITEAFQGFTVRVNVQYGTATGGQAQSLAQEEFAEATGLQGGGRTRTKRITRSTGPAAQSESPAFDRFYAVVKNSENLQVAKQTLAELKKQPNVTQGLVNRASGLVNTYERRIRVLSATPAGVLPEEQPQPVERPLVERARRAYKRSPLVAKRIIPRPIAPAVEMAEEASVEEQRARTYPPLPTSTRTGRRYPIQPNDDPALAAIEAAQRRQDREAALLAGRGAGEPSKFAPRDRAYREFDRTPLRGRGRRQGPVRTYALDPGAGRPGRFFEPLPQQARLEEVTSQETVEDPRINEPGATARRHRVGARRVAGRRQVADENALGVLDPRVFALVEAYRKGEFGTTEEPMVETLGQEGQRVGPVRALTDPQRRQALKEAGSTAYGTMFGSGRRRIVSPKTLFKERYAELGNVSPLVEQRVFGTGVETDPEDIRRGLLGNPRYRPGAGIVNAGGGYIGVSQGAGGAARSALDTPEGRRASRARIENDMYQAALRKLRAENPEVAAAVEALPTAGRRKAFLRPFTEPYGNVVEQKALMKASPREFGFDQRRLTAAFERYQSGFAGREGLQGYLREDQQATPSSVYKAFVQKFLDQYKQEFGYKPGAKLRSLPEPIQALIGAQASKVRESTGFTVPDYERFTATGGAGKRFIPGSIEEAAARIEPPGRATTKARERRRDYGPAESQLAEIRSRLERLEGTPEQIRTAVKRGSVTDEMQYIPGSPGTAEEQRKSRQGGATQVSRQQLGEIDVSRLLLAEVQARAKRRTKTADEIRSVLSGAKFEEDPKKINKLIQNIRGVGVNIPEGAGIPGGAMGGIDITPAANIGEARSRLARALVQRRGYRRMLPASYAAADAERRAEQDRIEAGFREREAAGLPVDRGTGPIITNKTPYTGDELAAKIAGSPTISRATQAVSRPSMGELAVLGRAQSAAAATPPVEETIPTQLREGILAIRARADQKVLPEIRARRAAEEQESALQVGAGGRGGGGGGVGAGLGFELQPPAEGPIDVRVINFKELETLGVIGKSGKGGKGGKAAAETEAAEAKASEEKEPPISKTEPFVARARQRAMLLRQLQASGVALEEARPEGRPYTGKSPARIEAESEILEARALSPTRAFQTAVAAAFAKTIGGGGAFERRVKGLTGALGARADIAEEIGDTARELQAVRKNLTGVAAVAREFEAAGKPIPNTLVQYEESLQADRKALIERGVAQRGRRAEATEEVARRRGSLISPVGVARGFAALGVGAIVGGVIFSAASQAIQAALGTVEEQAVKAADALSGFAITASKTSQELASAVRSAAGDVRGGVAGAAAPSGIGAAAFERLIGPLGGRAGAIAAAQGRVQESDLFRTGASIGRGGFDAALFQGTGGILNSQLFAPQPGFLERITADLAQFNREPQRAQFNLGNGGITQVGRFGVGSPRSAAEAVPTPSSSVGNFFPVTPTRDMENFNTYVADLNEQLSKANSGFEVLTASTDTQREAMLKSAEAIGRREDAERLIRQGVTITGRGGGGLTGTQFGTAIEDLARGQNIVTPQVAFQQDQRQIQAQVRQLIRQRDYALQQSIPRQLALENLAAPATPVGTGIAPADRPSVAADLKAAAGYQAELNQRYAQGTQLLKDAIPAELYNSIEATGKAIADTQAAISNSQANLQLKEYNNQLFIAKRSYSDILGLQDKSVHQGASQLGVLERQNVELSRQSEALQRMLQQRQINFQLATAGFIVAGQSPEERAARIKDARTQAEFAQKQLDIQKKAANNNIKIFDLQNVNAARDALAAISLLREGRSVTINTKAAEEKLQRLQKLQADNVKRAGKYLEAVEGEASIAQSEIYKLEAAYGKAVDGITRITIQNFIKFVRQLATNMPFTASYGPNDLGSNRRGYAAGGVFSTSGRTDITVGEAGNETVAVVRNPRSVSPTSMSGGGGVTININNPVVREDGDINKITQSVIRALNTRTALLGLR